MVFVNFKDNFTSQESGPLLKCKSVVICNCKDDTPRSCVNDVMTFSLRRPTLAAEAMMPVCFCTGMQSQEQQAFIVSSLFCFFL